MRALVLALFALLLLANTTTDTAERLMEEGKEAEAFAMIESAASQGDAESVNFLAWFYDNGRYVAADKPKAALLYRQAAQSGQAFAMWRLAVMIDEGEAEGTLEEAVEMLKAAADLGYSNAWASLGVMHATGHGTDTDFAAAIEAYQRASEMGNSYGFHGLGVLYYDGQGVPANDFEAMAYWYVAAMMDNSGSQDNFEQFAGDFSDEEMGRILARAQEIAEMFELDLMF